MDLDGKQIAGSLPGRALSLVAEWTQLHRLNCWPTGTGHVAMSRLSRSTRLPSISRVEELVGCPIALLSTSPEREDTILVQNPFEA